MKSIREIRRESLVRLVAGYKSQRQFAHSTGLVPAHLSQLLGGVREMGENVARRIEEALGLASGFMSLDPEASVTLPTIEEALHALPADELKLLADYRRVSSRHKEMLRETVEGYLRLEERSS